MLLKDRLSNTHFKFRTTLNLQKASGSSYWNSNNYRTVSCSSFLNLTCQIRNACIWNRKQLQNSNLLCLNQLLSCYRKTRLHIIEKQWLLLRFQNEFLRKRVLKPWSALWFSLPRDPTLKKILGPAPALHKQLQ